MSANQIDIPVLIQLHCGLTFTPSPLHDQQVLDRRASKAFRKKSSIFTNEVRLKGLRTRKYFSASSLILFSPSFSLFLSPCFIALGRFVNLSAWFWFELSHCFRTQPVTLGLYLITDLFMMRYMYRCASPHHHVNTSLCRSF